MTQYMLMYSLGPVQTFIAQARKTRDLWQGSFLLSKLMEAAMRDLESIAQKPLKDFLVFPVSPSIERNISDIPNKYVAIFGDPIKAQKVAEESTERVKAWWKTTHEAVWQDIIQKSRMWNTETRNIWDRQTNPDTLFEIYWIITEQAPQQEYGDWLRYTQYIFDARKRLRNFSTQDEPGEKSTVSGEREVLRGSGQSRTDVKAFWRDLGFRAGLSAKDIDRKGAERLDAIDTVKRFAKLRNDQAFPSTSTVATASFVRHLLAKVDLSTIQEWLNVTALPVLKEMQPNAIPYLATYVSKETRTDKRENMRQILQRDGDCFLPETFTTYRLEKDYSISAKADENDANQATRLAIAGQRALAKLFAETDKQKIARPTPYYAILQMDGDNMGTFLGGVKSQIDHSKISTALSKFSRDSVPKIVEQDHPGRLVYAGGDDVLAFTPLEGLLDLANKLQDQYCEKVRGTAPDREDQVSASTGIAIAHHYTPLNLALQAARDAEKLAKGRYGRNALVVTIMRRSGEQTRVGCRWSYDGLHDAAQPMTLFSRFYHLFDQDVLSPKCVYTLLEEAPILVKIEDIKAQKSEIKRILKRQCSGANAELLPEPDKDLAALAEYLGDLAVAMDKVVADSKKDDTPKSVELHTDKLHYGLVETLGWLLVMVFLARKVQD